jgi:1,4-dihydroxy-2-naphthoyl-CoA hydrolase
MSDIIDAIARRAMGTMLDTVGFRLVELNAEHAVAEMGFRPDLAQLTGLFHAGALLALADSTATSLCISAADPEGTFDPSRFPLAVQLSANLIRNTGAGTVTAEARLLHKGRTTMVRDGQGRLLVAVTSTHLVLASASQS